MPAVWHIHLCGLQGDLRSDFQLHSETVIDVIFHFKCDRVACNNQSSLRYNVHTNKQQDMEDVLVIEEGYQVWLWNDFFFKEVAISVGHKARFKNNNNIKQKDLTGVMWYCLLSFYKLFFSE